MDYYQKLAIILVFCSFSCYAWERESTCPLICTCQLQPLTETAIYRFMQKEKIKPVPGEVKTTENNEVVYDETLDPIELLEEGHRSIVVRAATCILQTETDPLDLIESLASNFESLTFIQAYKSGNKTIKFSWLSKFDKLLSLELIGPTIFRKDVDNHLMCHIDYALENLNFLNLERVLVKNSKEQIQSFLEVLKESENITFEYVRKVDGIHPITIIQKGSNNEEIVPYEVFKEQRKTSGEIPLFTGFKRLLLLRIANCEINSIHWEMFDGLNDLQFLNLERNNLTFIPAFAFYGTPSLKSLSLAHNKLLDIEITDLAGLLQLEYLDLTYNEFTHLSELSFPPFPRLKLANFANNPISTVFPNTFEVMNTTDSLIIGSEGMALTLLPNSFSGLRMLKILTINNVNVPLLKRELFSGMPQLKELIITGNIGKIEFDAFQEVPNLETVILSNCKIFNISMDGFLGLNKVKYLDLSKNELEYLPSGVFDDLENIRELYLNGNKFRTLPRDIFSKIYPRLLRLNENPWHCSCEMSEWKPIIASRIKQKTLKSCDFPNDKGLACASIENKFEFKYVYDTRVSPRCTEPEQYKKWSVFHAMRKILKCPDYKPKIKKNKPYSNSIEDNFRTTVVTKISRPQNQKLKAKVRKSNYIKYKLKSKTLLANKMKLEDYGMDSDIENDFNNIRIQSEESNRLPVPHINISLLGKKDKKTVSL
ncbi:toll-like receptor 13 [Euwallacea similis]|uniref:toll-like receptor 13 n=1 Tax=Euwallacea similis TaxID=1736056 RepID=UPI003450448E